jgi:hypothetical protein
MLRICSTTLLDIDQGGAVSEITIHPPAHPNLEKVLSMSHQKKTYLKK